MLQVCLCTHNPRLDVFERVLESLACQTIGPRAFEVVVIDNGSTPPVSLPECRRVLGPVPVRVVREPRPGLAAARARGVAVTDAEWLVLVDDDTELMPDYLECALRIIAQNPGLGCFGGKLLLPDDIVPDAWMRPLLGFLAIRDAGDEPITACANSWGVWEPPAAGAVVRRPLLERYRAIVAENKLADRLGRKGTRSFGAGEDALLMRGAYDVHLSASYQPSLRLTHHIDRSRLTFRYLLGLMYGHGRSRIVLERVLGDADREEPATTGRSPLARVAQGAYSALVADPLVSWRYACCMAAYRVGSISEQLSRSRDDDARPIAAA
ncbi:MAG TPA: glycosyltransferase [Methylomirabilota bacterium]|nr:glycosyltransferase [Methylomirabilota bacterium]